MLPFSDPIRASDRRSARMFRRGRATAELADQFASSLCAERSTTTNMTPSLCPSTNVPAPVLLVLAAIAIHRSVVHAQSTNGDPYNYYYWLTPGRIVGIAIGLFSHLVALFEHSVLDAYCSCRCRCAGLAHFVLDTLGLSPSPQR